MLPFLLHEGREAIEEARESEQDELEAPHRSSDR